jgi:hypothetical protein
VFKIRYRHFEYLVILFRLTNTPIIFIQLINNTLRDCLNIFTIVYFNDILIYLEDEKQHIEYIKKVL